ncbi:Putative aliphatic sulfonates-binding protein [Sporomusa silvacetica DSM 10669]|uniref:Aliphatic sulfonates-binding protein n=1 Tax=Sporomusa silvacetica DSM 10669 TaxID=1123289 RepID=A0ABZ3IHT8_9FIRM|nr:ABC transporter substrate-binding protein [Sporomusa silvacetica]OZC14831.1 putative aliphatic sulfonates-binding protein precursor [Sporomusa silvacetica DSM 10669]
MIFHKRKRQLTSLIIIIALTTLFVVGCGAGKGTETSAKPGAKAVVEFKYPDNPSFDLFYIADELGYFKDSGVQPKYVGRIAEGQIIPSVGTGAIDFGNRHSPLVISAIANGSDVKIIAAGTKSTQESPHMKYFVQADSPIKDLKDLVGKKVGINSFGACSEYVTKKFLQDNGLEGKVQLIQIPNDQLDQVLKQGVVDVSIIHPPQSGRAEKTPELRKLFSDYDIDQGISGMNPITVNGKFARENPEALKTIVGILAKTAKWVNEHPAEARQVIAKRLKMDVNLVENYAYYSDQIVPAKEINYWIDRLIAEGKISQGQVKLEAIYTNEYNPNNK